MTLLPFKLVQYLAFIRASIARLLLIGSLLVVCLLRRDTERPICRCLEPVLPRITPW